MRPFLLALSVLLCGGLFAQDPADIFHKTFDLDSVNQVTMNVYEHDRYEVKTWPGDDVLVETSVILNNGQSHILKFFLKEKRWELKAKPSGDQLLLKSYDMQRRLVQGKAGMTSETVNIVIYMPDTFADNGAGVWTRKGK